MDSQHQKPKQYVHKPSHEQKEEFEQLTSVDRSYPARMILLFQQKVIFTMLLKMD